MQGSMEADHVHMMPLMYLFFCPPILWHSLYYVISNIVMTVQDQVIRKVSNPIRCATSGAIEKRKSRKNAVYEKHYRQKW